VIRLSRAAQEQLSGLATYYDGLDRPEAVRSLRAAVGRAGERIEAQRGPFFPAPRPYPKLARPGWLWLKEASYWIAYANDAQGSVIRAVFFETADIPERM